MFVGIDVVLDEVFVGELDIAKTLAIVLQKGEYHFCPLELAETSELDEGLSTSG